MWCALATATFLDAQTARPAGWVESTHGRQAAPDYGRLFAMDKVHELNITIAPESFRQMKADLETVAALRAVVAARWSRRLWSRGRRGRRRTAADHPRSDVRAGDRNHDGRVWTQVGMRYKGNSSLMMASIAATGRFRSARLRPVRGRVAGDPGQRFHGFQSYVLSNFGDDSQIREPLADRGVPRSRRAGPRAAFYRVSSTMASGNEGLGPVHDDRGPCRRRNARRAVRHPRRQPVQARGPRRRLVAVRSLRASVRKPTRTRRLQ